MRYPFKPRGRRIQQEQTKGNFVMKWVIVQQTCIEQWQGQPMVGWVTWKDAHNKPKTVGEALGVKKRNPIESVFYKRKVTMAERWGGKKTEERKNTERKETQGGRGT